MSKRSIFVVGSLAVLALLFFSCTTVSRPDMPKVKGYEAKQTRVLGILPLKPHYEPVPTRADATRETLRRPAETVLWLCLPVALVAFAASIVIANPQITNKLVTLAAIAFLAAVCAGVWLLMTMWLIAFAAVACAVGGYAYWKFHGKGVKLGIKQ